MLNLKINIHINTNNTPCMNILGPQQKNDTIFHYFHAVRVEFCNGKCVEFGVPTCTTHTIPSDVDGCW